MARDRAGDRRVEAALDAVFEPPSVEREEVGALLPFDVDHLDELALAHFVGERSRFVDAEVEPGLREGRRKLELTVAAGRRPADLDEEIGWRRRAIDDPACRRRDHDLHLPLGAERVRGTGRGRVLEEPDGARLLRIEPRKREHSQESVPVSDQVTEHGRRRVRALADRARVLRAFGRQYRELRDLTAVLVDDCHSLVSAERDDGRAAGAHEVRLDEGILGQETPIADDGHYAFCAGAFASISDASAMSFSASSRLPSASSFLTSFSTARRLNVWFQ